MSIKRSKSKPRSRKLKRTRSKQLAQVSNRFEASYSGYDGNRSYLPGAIVDARIDASEASRMELVRRARYWGQNSALMARLRSVFCQYVVGPTGLQVIPSVGASDEDGRTQDDAQEFNQSAAHWWNDWSKFPDAQSSHQLATIQNLMAGTWFDQGEVFIYKTFSRNSNKPRIQLIEGQRVGTPPHLRDQEGKTIIDGICFDTDADGMPAGRPTGYWVRTDDMGVPFGTFMPSNGVVGSWKWIPAERMLHLFEPWRPGSARGIPCTFPVLNDIHDLEDLQFLEQKAARNAAKITNVVTNKTGENPTASMRRQKWQIQSQDANGNANTKQIPVFYEMTMGGQTLYQVHGDDIKQFKSDRPSVVTREYWDYLVRKICAGVGISALLVLPFSLQGTVTRADLDIAAIFFRTKSNLFAGILREIYLWAMGWAVKYDRSMDGAPRDWWHIDIRPPRSVNVDVGRNSQAVIAEMRAGIRTYRDACGELGKDWRQVLEQKAVEAAFINSLVDKHGVTREQIALLANASFTERESHGESTAEIRTENPGNPQTDLPPEPPTPQNAQPITVNVENNIPAQGNRRVVFKRDEIGGLISAELEESK